MMEFSPYTDRVSKYREALRDRTIEINAERGLITMESYKKYMHYPPILRKPLITKELFEQMTITIDDNDLFCAQSGAYGFNVETHINSSYTWPDNDGSKWIIAEWERGKFVEYEPGMYKFDGDNAEQLIISKETMDQIYSYKDFWWEWGFGHYHNSWQPDGYRQFVEVDATEYFKDGDFVDHASGHLTPGIHNIIRKGYGAIRRQAQDFLDAHFGNLMGEDVAKYLFYYSVTIICDAAKILHERYAQACEAKAKDCKDPVRKAEFEMMADGLRNLATNPARSFWEALQGTLLYKMIIALDQLQAGISWGRVDQYSWPYLEKDLADDRITMEQAQEMIDMFVLKGSAGMIAIHPMTASVVGSGNTFQHVTLGGQTKQGEDATNPVTYMVLQTMGRLHLHDPLTSLRIHKDTPQDLWDFSVKVTQEVGGLPLFQNDEVIIPGLVKRLEFSLEDARDYSIIGCQEIVGSGTDFPEGSGTDCGGAVMYSRIFVTALNNGVNPMNGRDSGCRTGYLYDMKSMDEVRAAVYKQTDHFLKWMTSMNNYAQWVNNWEVYHATLSIGIDDCMELGKDCTQGGARYNSYGSTAVGLGTVGDSLTAIKYMCFDKKLCTPRELYNAYMADWEGYEELQQRILRDVPHYGNDDPYADEEMAWIAQAYIDICDEIYSVRTKHYKPGMYSAAAHIVHGWGTWATPDGRNSGTPLANAAGAGQGREEHGPIAVLNSATCFDQGCMQNGIALNLKIHPTALQGDGVGKLEQMTQAYFDNGGAELQFNIVSTDTMRAAQKEPEKYRDLVVRIAGYSAYFTELPERLQADLIARDEHLL
jgi:formate C-acetyltransferase